MGETIWIKRWAIAVWAWLCLQWHRFTGARYIAELVSANVADNIAFKEKADADMNEVKIIGGKMQASEAQLRKWMFEDVEKLRGDIANINGILKLYETNDRPRLEALWGFQMELNTAIAKRGLKDGKIIIPQGSAILANLEKTGQIKRPG